MINQNEIINMLRKGYNPQQLLFNILQNEMGGTPLGDNLLTLARQGNTAEIEKIARNIVTSSGGDYDKEFSAFRQRLGL